MPHDCHSYKLAIGSINQEVTEFSWSGYQVVNSHQLPMASGTLSTAGTQQLASCTASDAILHGTASVPVHRAEIAYALYVPHDATIQRYYTSMAY